ncbi:putative UDP-Gal or UDP-GlcNAc-dependent glycosyltransferase [Trypanosoma vivax]|nr:putative UDP-Gal or UDP-GlcNAc-dependent glycosyltransferase [Trypanosoma vivax]
MGYQINIATATCFGVYLLVSFNIALSLYRYDNSGNSFGWAGLLSTPDAGESAEIAYTESDKKALQYIPPETLQTWRGRDFLVALGIPSPDNDERRERRFLQRDSCWTYKGVATARNKFTGDMIVLYVLAQHPQHDYKYSKELEAEAREWQDVIALPIHEGRVSTNKKVGEVAHWGIDAEIGMSRKVFLWFDMAFRILPKVSYISKGDDDAFYHAPQYVVDMRTLPRQRIYWAFHWRINPKDPFNFGRGLLYTLSRDVAQKFITYEPIRRLVHVPFTIDRKQEFTSLIMEYEDAMVGRAISRLKIDDLIYVNESCCRFIILNGGECKAPQNNDFVVVHGVEGQGYKDLMERFSHYTTPVPVKFVPFTFGLKASCAIAGENRGR